MGRKLSLMTILNKLKAAIRKIGEKRSSGWPKVEKEFLKTNSECAACGSTKHLNVHHKKPFHIDPSLELDVTNLITLCMDKDCHLLIGHGDDFKAYNPDVMNDASIVHADLSRFKEVIAEAKLKRQYK